MMIFHIVNRKKGNNTTDKGKDEYNQRNMTEKLDEDDQNSTEEQK